MKFIFSYFAIIFLLVSNTASASIKSCPIYIRGGVAYPGEKLTLTVDRLPPNIESAYYTLTCEMINPRFNQPHPAIIKIWSTKGNISVNGQATQHGQVRLKQSLNTLEVRNINIGRNPDNTISQSDTYILNLDEQDAVTVGNCVARLSN